MRWFGTFVFGAVLSILSGYMFLGELIFNSEFNISSLFACLGFALISFLGKRAHGSQKQR